MNRITHALAPLILVACVSCGDSGDTADAHAAAPATAGAVLAVDGIPVFPEDVDRIADALADLFPEYVERHRRRLALTNVVLARTALHAKNVEAREEARMSAEAAAEALRQGQAPGREPQSDSGHWKKLGLELWSRLRVQEEGSWSEPFEDLGRFLIVKRTKREQVAEEAEGEVYSMEILEFPYLESGKVTTGVEAAIDGSLLEILDPDWAELVPEEWKYRMRGEQ